ncbi:Hypp3549 [Branchiostoma lanceolatum]|uniref:Hypp3549 protein n=1 Tax=Branchiostoma lanceolatum TaxID=7740 RepID=A0A8K0A387_BRALA|nr:Hypp3549 [Branchiostoma lanceolatum]
MAPRKAKKKQTEHVEEHVEEHAPTVVEQEEPKDKPNLEDAIADFYEATKLFYDEGDPQYRNREKKRLLLATFCNDYGMGIKPEDVTRRFKSQRTEYVKLKRTKKARSGSGRVSLTSLQRWKLERFQFLDPYCIDYLPQDLRSVHVTVGKEDETEVVEDEQVAGTSTGGVTPCGSFAIGSGKGHKKRPSPGPNPTDPKKKGPTTSSLPDILAKLLDESTREK